MSVIVHEQSLRHWSLTNNIERQYRNFQICLRGLRAIAHSHLCGYINYYKNHEHFCLSSKSS